MCAGVGIGVGIGVSDGVGEALGAAPGEVAGVLLREAPGGMWVPGILDLYDVVAAGYLRCGFAYMYLV
mgnify:CR=1 FL=1